MTWNSNVKIFCRIFTILLKSFFKSLGLYILVSGRLDLTQKYVSSCVHGFTWSSSNCPLEWPTNFGYQPLHIAHVEKHTGNKKVGNQIDIWFLRFNFRNWLTKKEPFSYKPGHKTKEENHTQNFEHENSFLNQKSINKTWSIFCESKKCGHFVTETLENLPSHFPTKNYKSKYEL